MGLSVTVFLKKQAAEERAPRRARHVGGFSYPERGAAGCFRFEMSYPKASCAGKGREQGDTHERLCREGPRWQFWGRGETWSAFIRNFLLPSTPANFQSLFALAGQTAFAGFVSVAAGLFRRLETHCAGLAVEVTAAGCVKDPRLGVAAVGRRGGGLDWGSRFLYGLSRSGEGRSREQECGGQRRNDCG